MSTQPESYCTPQEYLAIERQSDCRHDYYDGEMFAMAGASRAHQAIAGNLVASLVMQLRGKPCTVYPADLRVKVSATGLYTYPDVIVACDEQQFDDEQQDTLLNPRLLIEVLSKSTESYDRGKKFSHYRTIQSLVDYLLVAQDEPRVEHYARTPDGWLLHEATQLDGRITLPTIGCELELSQVYDKVRFDEGREEPEKAG